MMPLTGKERRKYLEALKENNASGEHIKSDPTGVLLRKGGKRKDTTAGGEAPGDIEINQEKAASIDLTDLTSSPPSKKTRTGSKGTGRVTSAEADAAFESSLWYRDFNYRCYVEDHVPFSAVDKDAAFHGKFDELAQDAGTNILRTMLYVQSMERKYEVLEKEFQDSAKDVEKYKHKAATFEERVSRLLKDKEVAEKSIASLEQEKEGWQGEKSELEGQVANLKEDLSKSQGEVDEGKMALASFFEDGFERAKAQVLHFYPDLDFSGLDSLKIVQDGELVDEP